MSRRWSDWMLLVVPGAIWGASFLFIAEGLEAMAPAGVTFVRVAIGFVCLAAVPAARRPLAPGDGWPTAWLGVLWLAVPLSLFPIAEQRVSSALTGMLNGAAPVTTALVAALLSRRWPERATLVGLVTGITGTALIAVPDVDGSSSAFGVALIVIAIVLYGIALNVARPLQQRSGALPVVWRALGVAVLLTAPFGVPALLDARWTTRSLASMVALGALGTCAANVLMTIAAGRLGPTRASATLFLMPIVALALGVAVRGEHVAPLSIGGAAVCLIGAALLRRPAGARPVIPQLAISQAVTVGDRSITVPLREC